MDFHREHTHDNLKTACFECGEHTDDRFEERVIRHLRNMEAQMSALTDQVDAALAVLATDAGNEQSVIDTLNASIATLQAQLASVQSDNTADEAELQKALDGLTAAHSALTGGAGTPAAPVTTDPSTPVDSAPVDTTPPGVTDDGTAQTSA